MDKAKRIFQVKNLIPMASWINGVFSELFAGSWTSQLWHCRQLIVGKEAGNGRVVGWLGDSQGERALVFSMFIPFQRIHHLEPNVNCAEDHTPHCSTSPWGKVSSPFACDWGVTKCSTSSLAMPGTSRRGKHLIIILVLCLRFLRVKVWWYGLSHANLFVGRDERTHPLCIKMGLFGGK